MKFVYLHPTYVISVLNIGLNLTCQNSAFREFALDLHPICTLSQRKHDSRYVMKYVHSVSTFGYIH